MKSRIIIIFFTRKRSQEVALIISRNNRQCESFQCSCEVIKAGYKVWEIIALACTGPLCRRSPHYTITIPELLNMANEVIQRRSVYDTLAPVRISVRLYFLTTKTIICPFCLLSNKVYTSFFQQNTVLNASSTKPSLASRSSKLLLENFCLCFAVAR